LTAQAFYDKMAATEELPKTSQPSISDLVLQLENRLTAIHTSLVYFYRQVFQDFGKIFNI
jgi:fatty acid-binding protein DegV